MPSKESFKKASLTLWMRLKQRSDIRIAHLSRDIQRSLTFGVLDTNIGTSVKQMPDHVHLTSLHRLM